MTGDCPQVIHKTARHIERMTWFRIDDGFHSHPKVMRAGTAAAGLFVRCGSYAAQHLTDGFVPAEVAAQYGSTEWIQRLIDAGLWVTARGGYRMPDYLDYNLSRERVLTERRNAAERQKRARERALQKAAGLGKSTDKRSSRRDSRVSNTVSNASVTVPPTPSSKEEGRGAPASPGGARPSKPPHEPTNGSTDQVPDWHSMPALGQISPEQIALNVERAAQARAAIGRRPPPSAAKPSTEVAPVVELSAEEAAERERRSQQSLAELDRAGRPVPAWNAPTTVTRAVVPMPRPEPT